MFDLPLEELRQFEIEAELPARDEAWRIGAIVGPSGSGKSSVARAAFGDDLCRSEPWPHDRAIVDAVGGQSIHEITAALAAVGLNSPPAWIRPYHLLSTGQQFRADLARALLSERELIVCDEFTSTVDRTVARAASAAVSKAIHGGRITKRFVAVTCHTDVLPWLAADWHLDLATGRLARGCLQRSRLALEVVRCRQSAWQLFAPHHYLTSSLPRAATCWMAVWDDRPVAFCATAGMLGYKGRKRVTRIVTLPDYQGLGIGSRLLDRVCTAEHEAGFRINLTTSHPAMIAALRRSPRWRAVGLKRLGAATRRRRHGMLVKSSQGRSVASFEYWPGDQASI